MKGKKSFVLYADYKHTIDLMPDEKAGQLFKIILDYVNDLDPKIDDLTLLIAFSQIKQQLKRDLKIWEDKKKARAEAGRKGGLARGSKSKQKLSKEAVNDNDNGNDNVIDYKSILNNFNLSFNKKTRVFPESIKTRYRSRIKDGYTFSDICKVMETVSQDDWHKENDFKYCTLEYFSRVKTLDKYLYLSNGTKKNDNKYIPTL